MRQSNRDQHNRKGAAQKRGGGSGYRGSYYGSDSYESASISYRGRGPKDYVRSDERLREIICEHLTDDPDIDASDIGIEVRNLHVRLTGSIEDRELKQEVEALIERIGGVRGIDNQLRTRSAQPRTFPSALDYDPAMLDETATIAEETGVARCGDRSPDLPEQ
jgi:hypothetical protein